MFTPENVFCPSSYVVNYCKISKFSAFCEIFWYSSVNAH